MKQQEEMVKKEKETADKIAARAFAQSYLSDLVPSVFGTLAENGYFYDPVERGMTSHFWTAFFMDCAYITRLDYTQFRFHDPV